MFFPHGQRRLALIGSPLLAVVVGGCHKPFSFLIVFTNAWQRSFGFAVAIPKAVDSALKLSASLPCSSSLEQHPQGVVRIRRLRLDVDFPRIERTS